MTLLAFLGPTEWIVIAILAVLIFGKRLPEIGRSLGQGMVEFKKGLSGVKDEMKDAVDGTKDVASAARDAAKPAEPQQQAQPPATPKA
jgi:sec-independent protein translocase protein TatA